MINEFEATKLREVVALLQDVHERTHDYDATRNCVPYCEFPNVLVFLRDLITPHPGRCDFCGRSEACDSARPGSLCDVALPPELSWIPRLQPDPLTDPICKCGIPAREARGWVHDRGCEFHHSGSGAASPEVKPTGEPRPKCGGCGQEIDPEVCGCGSSRQGHGWGDGHPFIPMGCDCMRARAPAPASEARCPACSAPLSHDEAKWAARRYAFRPGLTNNPGGWAPPITNVCQFCGTGGAREGTP